MRLQKDIIFSPGIYQKTQSKDKETFFKFIKNTKDLTIMLLLRRNVDRHFNIFC